MSVLVKGIDMPTNCQTCPFSDDECRFCKAVKEYIPMLGKPKFCPLVAVSEDAVSPCEVCPLVKVDETAILDGWDKVYPDDDEVEPRYCDRNICASNEVNGIGCDECPIGKENK